MSSLVVDIGAGPPRSIIGAKLAEAFRKRNMPLLVRYAEETQQGQPPVGGEHTKPKPRRVLGLQELEEPHSPYYESVADSSVAADLATADASSSYMATDDSLPLSEYVEDVVGGAYGRRKTVERRVLGLQEFEEPKENHMSLSYYESQDDPDTPRIEGEEKAYSGGADGGADADEEHQHENYWPGDPLDRRHDDSDDSDYVDAYIGGSAYMDGSGYMGGGAGYMVPIHTYQSDVDVDDIPLL